MKCLKIVPFIQSLSHPKKKARNRLVLHHFLLRHSNSGPHCGRPQPRHSGRMNLLHRRLWPPAMRTWRLEWGRVTQNGGRLQQQLGASSKKQLRIHKKIFRYRALLGDFKIPSGKLTKSCGKSPFFMGKSTISMAIFHGKMLVHQRVFQPLD